MSAGGVEGKHDRMARVRGTDDGLPEPPVFPFDLPNLTGGRHPCLTEQTGRAFSKGPLSRGVGVP